MMKRLLRAAGVVAGVVVAALALLYAISPVRPIAWEPPPPFAGACPESPALAALERVAPQQLPGAEAIYVDAETGSLITGLKDGRIVRVALAGAGAGGVVQELANTQGRPLGIKRARDGRLLIADAHKGLLVLAPDGKLETVADALDGAPFVFTDDLDVAADGTVYFTDASRRFSVEHFKEDLLEHGRTGRVLAAHPGAPGKVRVVVDGLAFANGIALAPDDSFLLVAETSEYRVQRYWLSGERKGQLEVTALLPGFPDNITRSGDHYWVAVGSPRNKLVDALAGSPWLRRIVGQLPDALRPQPQKVTMAARLDADGKLTQCVRHAAPDAFSPVASVVEHDGALYYGSFLAAGIGKTALP